MALPRCSAKTRTGSPCRHPAGWGTEHLGHGRCKLHGGASTGPGDRQRAAQAQRGNKNAVVTGEYESIILDALTPEEQGLFHVIRDNKRVLLDEQIRLAIIRERRMLQRVADLGGVPFTVVEKQSKAAENQRTGKFKSLEVTEHATLGQIQKIEEALTRIQSQIRQMLVDKHRIETGTPPSGDELERLFENMRRSRHLVTAGDGDGD